MRSSRHFAAPALALVCVAPLALAARAAAAQDAPAQEAGRVRGTVTDATGRSPVANVTLTLTPADGRAGRSYTAVTNPAGQYRMGDVAPGRYALTTRAIGFRQGGATVTVGAGAEAAIDFTLRRDELQLQEVIVTGQSQARTKLETPQAVTTINQSFIQERAPRGTADLLKAVPGFNVQSNFGEVGANVSVRGLPIVTGGFKYVSAREDGLPVFEVPDYVFANADAFLRQDLTLRTIETVRGGGAGVFGSNTPGAIVNFISRTGGETLAGDARAQAGAQGMGRLDLNYGGPLTGDRRWRFNVGGFYRYDQGVRPQAFPAATGGQLKANVTRLLEGANFIRFYAKTLDTQDAYTAGLPHAGLDPTSATAIPGFRLDRGSLNGQDLAQIRLAAWRDIGPTGAFQYQVRDAEREISARYNSLGSEVSLSVGDGWTLRNNARYISGSVGFSQLLDLSGPQPASVLPAGAIAALQGLSALPRFGGAGVPRGAYAQYSYVNPPVPSQRNIPREATAAPGASGLNPSGLNGNGLVVVAGMFDYQTPTLRNFIDDFQLTRKAGGHNLTLGTYLSTYQVERYGGVTPMLFEVADQPRLLNVDVRATGSDSLIARVTDNGVISGYNFANQLNARHRVVVGAAYLNDDWEVTPAFRVDAGVRLGRDYARGQAERFAARSFQVNQTLAAPNPPVAVPTLPLALNSVTTGTGQWRPWSYTFNSVNATLGSNYTFNTVHALFARVSRGNRNPQPQQWEFNTETTGDRVGDTRPGRQETVEQAEAGYKFAGERFQLFGTAFGTRVKNVLFTLQTATPQGGFVLQQDATNLRNYGLEVETILSPFTGAALRGLNLRLISTIQDPKFTKDFFYTEQLASGASVAVPATNISTARRPESAGVAQVVNYNGNALDDTPKFALDGTLGYGYERFNGYFNYRYTTERWANRRNSVRTPAFGEAFAGLGYQFRVVRLDVQATNLFNSARIVNPLARQREDLNAADVASPATRGLNPFGMSTPQLPRNVVLSLGYTF
jgi:outer membrane receptor protein involved in Fe transport